MASLAPSRTFSTFNIVTKTSHNKVSSLPRIQLCHKNHDDEPPEQIKRRELILKSSEIATIGAIFNFRFKPSDISGSPKYLGVQKNPPALALCPATKNCVSTSENVSDLTHYAPPW